MNLTFKSNYFFVYKHFFLGIPLNRDSIFIIAFQIDINPLRRVSAKSGRTDIFPYFCTGFMGTQKSAILFGATGLIGKQLLYELLDCVAYVAVTAVVRRDTGIRHAKLKQLIVDYSSLSDIKEQLLADDVFCCLGTTSKKTPNLEEYYRIDHDYPVAAARYTRENGARAFLFVSAVGANPTSSNFYLRMKGETERDIISLSFEQTHIFRPSLLMGDRPEKRGIESLGGVVLKAFNSLLISNLSKYKAIPSAWVAKALCRVALQGEQGVHTYYWADIRARI